MIDRDIGTQESENEWETELREMILYTYYIAGRVEVVLYVLDGSIFGRRSISRAFASGEDRGGEPSASPPRRRDGSIRDLWTRRAHAVSKNVLLFIIARAGA